MDWIMLNGVSTVKRKSGKFLILAEGDIGRDNGV